MRPMVLALAITLCRVSLAADLKPTSSAEACGDCHRAIHAGWKKSAHATAMESRLFQDALKVAESEFGAQSRRVCLSCHSPIAVQTGDLDLVKKVSWEGVTCDYCHSIEDISEASGNFKARVEFSLVKSGPTKDLESPAHGTRFSPVHTSSLACVVCHEYRNTTGFAVLTTYSEWKESPYGKKKEDCQWCHMATVAGDVVDPRVKRSSTSGINLHEIPGSHSIQQLNKAIRADLITSREGDQLMVHVKVTNQGAGHFVPTGSPLRQLLMELRADAYGGRRFREQRKYTRVVSDRNGFVLNRESAVFIKAAQVVKDTRLAPNETRTEKFSFPIPRGTHAEVEATFFYYYSPTATTEAEQKVKFLTIRRMVQ
ncbi:MAG: multiheme c-type cytochrome [Terriglobia bacterium]